MMSIPNTSFLLHTLALSGFVIIRKIFPEIVDHRLRPFQWRPLQIIDVVLSHVPQLVINRQIFQRQTLVLILQLTHQLILRPKRHNTYPLSNSPLHHHIKLLSDPIALPPTLPRLLLPLPHHILQLQLVPRAELRLHLIYQLIQHPYRRILVLRLTLHLLRQPLVPLRTLLHLADDLCQKIDRTNVLLRLRAPVFLLLPLTFGLTLLPQLLLEQLPPVTGTSNLLLRLLHRHLLDMPLAQIADRSQAHLMVLTVLGVVRQFHQLQGVGVHPVSDVTEEILGYPQDFLHVLGHYPGVQVVDRLFSVLQENEVELVVAVEGMVDDIFELLFAGKCLGKHCVVFAQQLGQLCDPRLNIVATELFILIFWKLIQGTWTHRINSISKIFQLYRLYYILSLSLLSNTSVEENKIFKPLFKQLILIDIIHQMLLLQYEEQQTGTGGQLWDHFYLPLLDYYLRNILYKQDSTNRKPAIKMVFHHYGCRSWTFHACTNLQMNLGNYFSEPLEAKKLNDFKTCKYLSLLFNYIKQNYKLNYNSVEQRLLIRIICFCFLLVVYHNSQIYRLRVYQQNIINQRYPNYFSNQMPDQMTTQPRFTTFSSPTNLEMDVRDERLSIPFISKIIPAQQPSKTKGQFQSFLEQIRDWLVDTIQITTSISFNHLKKGHLSANQIKNFTMKNLLINIKQVFERYQGLSIQNKVELMKFINQQSLEIFQHIMYKYPQNSTKGASKRVKNSIPKIDNRQSDQFDFLRTTGINIAYNEKGDYSEIIMKIINKLISFSNEPFDLESQNKQTNFQVFTDIMEYIFQNANSQPILTMLNGVVSIIQSKHEAQQDLHEIKPIIEVTLNLATELASKQNKQYHKPSNHHPQAKHYLIGQKIPSGTKLFTKQDINGCHFKVNDSSVLRILTKWAEQLHSKLLSAQQKIYTRYYKFKNTKGHLVYLNNDLRQHLYMAAKQQTEIAEEYIEFLKKQNIYLQTHFAQEHSNGKYSKHDTNVGIFSAKNNQISSQYIFKYINKLIHCLMKVSKKAAQPIQNEVDKNILQSVNLVTLKIGDLMRCKHSCSEHQFIKTIQLLQEIHQKNPEILKIVRIKNRLQKKDNDLLINLFFMNKLQCQLQLSIHGNINKLQKNYSDFCHLIYQIIRARLGPISQMSSIVCQYDPLANCYSKSKTFGPKLKNISLSHKMKNKQQQNIRQHSQFKEKMNIGRTIQLPFICCKCRKLTVVNNPQFYYRDKANLQPQCNECRYSHIINHKPKQAFNHMISQSFKNYTQRPRNFIKNHISFWNTQEFIKQLQSNKMDSKKYFDIIPSKGLVMTTNQKLPKLLLYSTAFEPSQGNYIFAHIDEANKQKIICKLPVKHQKRKQIQTLKHNLRKLLIFKFQKANQTIDNAELTLHCTRRGCCGKKIMIGQILQSEEIIDLSAKKYITNLLQNQKSIFRLNKIKYAFQKLSDLVATFRMKNPLFHKIFKSVQVIKASRCSISDTKVIQNFQNLTQISLSHNKDIVSLTDLRQCKLLKNLDIRNCNLRNLDDLRQNSRLQYVNASQNQNLMSISGLQKHSSLIELILSYTSVSNLSPLKSCKNLQILDLQSCREIQDISMLNISKFSFLNTNGCIKLKQKYKNPYLEPQDISSLSTWKKRNSETQLNVNSLNVYQFSPTKRRKSHDVIRSQKMIREVSIEQIIKNKQEENNIYIKQHLQSHFKPFRLEI